MTDVFISYKREDRLAVEIVASALIDLDLDVWFDAGLEVGEKWEIKILAQAERAKAMLVCWTPLSCTSAWVLREAEIGKRRDVLAPVKLAECGLPAAFAALNAADLTAWRGALDAPPFQRVLERLELLTGNENLARKARSRAGGQRGDVIALLRQLLVTRALSGLAPFTYRQAEGALRRAARAYDVDLEDFTQPALWGALDAIAEQNRDRREPPLCALVVQADTKLPGRGYFQKHVFLPNAEDALARAVFARHLEDVRAHRWPQDV